MASGKDLTRLATLAGMAYIANKMGDKGDSSKTDAGDQKTSSYTGAETKTKGTSVASEAPTADEGTKSKVLEAITAKREAPNDQASNQGVIDDSKPASIKPKPRPKRTGMTGAQNMALAKANQGMSKASITAAKDEDARLGNIKAARDYNRGRDMESQILNNMITNPPMKKGGAVKKMASGGMTSKVSSASSRADGIASRGKTKCKMY
jgi:hypothetical protein